MMADRRLYAYFAPVSTRLRLQTHIFSQVVMRWIQRYVPEFEKRWNRFACRAGASWRVDETYVKIKGRWTYLYRAVDKQGQTVDFLLRAKRDVAAAKAFFRRAFESRRSLPRAITLDGYQASHRAVREFLATH